MVKSVKIKVFCKKDGKKERIFTEIITSCEDARRIFLFLYEKCCVPCETDNATLEINEKNDETYEISRNRSALRITGGRKRALLYGIYGFFGSVASYYYDYSVFPKEKRKLSEIPLEKENAVISKTPRFALRGMRYFAHRGLTRFQAEMWSEEDWKKEINWLVAKGYNMFMPRLGMEDVFQRAFPEICPYPENNKPLCENKHGFYDRTTGRSLKYRSDMMRHVYAYAKQMDLIVPVDCGTMTHWYSPTPKSYSDAVNPPTFSQSTSLYGDKTLAVWDIRIKECMSAYFALTDQASRDMGQDMYFHTIGLAERLFSSDRNANLELKTSVYLEISRYLKLHYPKAKLLISTWDFAMYWKPEEVKYLLTRLDKEQCIIFDYTSESRDDVNNFSSWGVCGNFPYVFGIFHAYEPNNDIRGDYRRIESRIEKAENDTSCTGFVLWPELSHGDMFMIEYASANATSPIRKKDFLPEFCKKRYTHSGEMAEIWGKSEKLISLFAWGFCSEHPERDVFRNYYLNLSPSEFGYSPDFESLSDSRTRCMEYYLPMYYEAKPKAAEIIGDCASLFKTADMCEKRDLFDIIRTICGRVLHFEVMRLQGDTENSALCDNIYSLLEAFTDFVSLNDEFSLNKSFERLKNETEINPYFETTLKENVLNEYCLTDITEVLRNYSLPVAKKVLDSLKSGGKTPSCDEIRENFLQAPIEKLYYRSNRSFDEIAEDIIEKIKFIIDTPY